MAGMLKIVLTTLIFLSAADIVANDGRYSESAGQVAAHIWYGIAGR